MREEEVREGSRGEEMGDNGLNENILIEEVESALGKL